MYHLPNVIKQLNEELFSTTERYSILNFKIKSLAVGSRVKRIQQASHQPCRFFHAQNLVSIGPLAQKLWPKSSSFGQINCLAITFKPGVRLIPNCECGKICMFLVTMKTRSFLLSPPNFSLLYNVPGF